MDVFAFIAFGVSLGSFEKEQPHPFAVAFDEVQSLSQKRTGGQSPEVAENYRIGSQATHSGSGKAGVGYCFLRNDISDDSFR